MDKKRGGETKSKTLRNEGYCILRVLKAVDWPDTLDDEGLKRVSKIFIKKNRRERSPKPSNSGALGIPSVLRKLRIEKASEPCPVKLQLSVKNCLKRLAGKQGVSSWIREAVIEKLERMMEED